MRILVLSTHDNRGGAAKAAYRFSKEFEKQGHDVCMYVRDKSLEDDFIVQSPKRNLFAKVSHFLDFTPGYILNGFDKGVQFTLGLFGENLKQAIKEFKPDVINIHWTWKGFVSFPKICKISKKIPVVYTMHDYSPFLGGITYPDQGEGLLVNTLSKLNQSLRKIFLKDSNITFVSPSEFLLEEFKKSTMPTNLKKKVINNGVEKHMFREQDKNIIRGKLNLQPNKKYILLGAVNLLNNPVKGGKILGEILHEMEEYLIKEEIGLVAFGSQNPFEQLKLDKGIEKKFLGFIKTEEGMARVLSSVNVMLVPSLAENYPFVVLEPLSCKTPVVAFSIGGIPEMIIHKGNGYLAKVGDKDNFIDGIKFCLEGKMNESKRDYSIETKAREYLKLFNNSRKTSLS